MLDLRCKRKATQKGNRRGVNRQPGESGNTIGQPRESRQRGSIGVPATEPKETELATEAYRSGSGSRKRRAVKPSGRNSEQLRKPQVGTTGPASRPSGTQ